MGYKQAEFMSVSIVRGGPSSGRDESWVETYEVPMYPRATILGALLHIQENIDPSLAFRYGCRFQKCGQCAVEVNGKPRLACRAYLQPGLTVRPLSKFPRLRDLIVDRSGLWEKAATLELYVPGRLDLARDISPEVAPLVEPHQHKRLMACRECLCCQAACPAWEGPHSSFGGPYLFVKLAQLHWDPRDHRDRREQARLLEIERCWSCGKCYCPNGMRIWKDAICYLGT